MADGKRFGGLSWLTWLGVAIVAVAAGAAWSWAKAKYAANKAGVA